MTVLGLSLIQQHCAGNSIVWVVVLQVVKVISEETVLS